MPKKLKPIVVRPGSRVRLAGIDPAQTGSLGDKAEALELVTADAQRIAELQENLYAENRRALLVVLQAMDTGGKDGTVRAVFSRTNPTGCQVVSFKQPSECEADHDFLWRIHAALPRNGNVGVFNRSHYEDVLVVRVHDLVPEKTWRARYDRINRWEQLVVESGTTMLKFFLHISKDEQQRRLEARLADKAKLWKFSPSDLAERKHWDAYQAAYEDALSKCSTKHAPWHIVPADKKWYRNAVIARTIVETLEEMDPKPPKVAFDPRKITIE